MKPTILFLALLFIAPRLLYSAELQRPNILFILTDDQRWDALSIAGHKQLKTPNIDRLGNEGVLFKNAFCTTSLCSPSRASILSGLYAHTHGVVNNFTEYPDNLKSFPQVLQDAGYDTAYIGKWHMGEENDQPRPGFDWFVTHQGQGKYFNTEFNFHGRRREVVKKYYTSAVTDMAEEWLERPRDGKPWLLMIGHKAPHSFYTPEPKYEKAFAGIPGSNSSNTGTQTGGNRGFTITTTRNSFLTLPTCAVFVQSHGNTHAIPTVMELQTDTSRNFTISSSIRRNAAISLPFRNMVRF
jgi:hypothetical protein